MTTQSNKPITIHWQEGNEVLVFFLIIYKSILLKDLFDLQMDYILVVACVAFKTCSINNRCLRYLGGGVGSNRLETILGWKLFSYNDQIDRILISTYLSDVRYERHSICKVLSCKTVSDGSSIVTIRSSIFLDIFPIIRYINCNSIRQVYRGLESKLKILNAKYSKLFSRVSSIILGESSGLQPFLSLSQDQSRLLWWTTTKFRNVNTAIFIENVFYLYIQIQRKSPKILLIWKFFHIMSILNQIYGRFKINMRGSQMKMGHMPKRVSYPKSNLLNYIYPTGR